MIINKANEMSLLCDAKQNIKTHIVCSYVPIIFNPAMRYIIYLYLKTLE